MNNKPLLFFFIFFTTFIQGLSAQSPEGDWYTPLRNKLLKVSISKDSLWLKKCDFETLNKGGLVNALKIEEEINHKYIVSETKDTVKTYYLIAFQLEKDKNGTMSIQSLEKEFATFADAKKEIDSVAEQSLNIRFLNKQSIESIKQKKPIAAMTADEFKSYAAKAIAYNKSHNQQAYRKYKLSYLYSESLDRLFLADLGFNSLVKGHVIDEMFEKFSEYPETKEIFQKMVQSTEKNSRE